ncbi:acyltransferase [Dethiobacter alkaliphilus]|uniref:acyltransferase n=1 Tax=Dethiobacter alkaliphilus TaxID=427926 RepID=UPI002226AEA7|nr:acyltransferase [Dethiobacter alkaliphilus]MCW3490629.1 acyltransferase [Dethiobacter alkaliphilus]
MKRKITRHQVPGPKNSLYYWTSYVNPLRVCFNFAVIFMCRFIPSLRLKNVLYRMVGIKIGKDVSVGLMVMFDVFFPQLITVGDNSVIGYNTTILAHEFMVHQWATGEVVIGRDVMIGANTTVLAGVTVGDEATVSAHSLVNHDVLPATFVGGVPAKEIPVSEPLEEEQNNTNLHNIKKRSSV